MDQQMQRPVMNPMFMADGEPGSAGPRRPRFGWVWKLLKKVFRIMFLEVISLRRSTLKIEDGTPLLRFIRGFTYRLAFVPVALVLFVVALVFAVTHPRQSLELAVDPMTEGIYYDPVTLRSEDGLQLEGWLIPAIDARQVIEQKDKVLHQKHAAVVLVHDFAGSPQQVLPLIQPLHEMGVVVLAVGLRGAGSEAGRSAGQTFGLDEAQDVQAAVEMLRRRSYVDSKRISIFGLGSGANAALLAAERDPSVASLILSGPVNGFEAAFKGRVGKEREWVDPLLPLCKWAFQVMYHVDADGLNMARFHQLMSNRPVLVFDAIKPGEPLPRQQVEATAEFLRRRLVAPAGVTALAD